VALNAPGTLFAVGCADGSGIVFSTQVLIDIFWSETRLTAAVSAITFCKDAYVLFGAEDGAVQICRVMKIPRELQARSQQSVASGKLLGLKQALLISSSCRSRAETSPLESNSSETDADLPSIIRIVATLPPDGHAVQWAQCLPGMHAAIVTNAKGRAFFYELDTGKCVGALAPEVSTLRVSGLERERATFLTPSRALCLDNAIVIALDSSCPSTTGNDAGGVDDASKVNEVLKDEGEMDNSDSGKHSEPSFALYFTWDIVSFFFPSIANALSQASMSEKCNVAEQCYNLTSPTQRRDDSICLQIAPLGFSASGIGRSSLASRNSIDSNVSSVVGSNRERLASKRSQGERPWADDDRSVQSSGTDRRSPSIGASGAFGISEMSRGPDMRSGNGNTDSFQSKNRRSRSTLGGGQSGKRVVVLEEKLGAQATLPNASRLSCTGATSIAARFLKKRMQGFEDTKLERRGKMATRRGQLFDLMMLNGRQQLGQVSLLMK
jgi:hypothetical protein